MASHSIHELQAMCAALHQGRYPDFVVPHGFAARPPIFYYHSVTRRTFAAHLGYLERNGYQTITADEATDVAHAQSDHRRCVMLSFDDGLADLYTIAFPLLQQFQMRAVAFIIPEWVGAEGMATWEQLAEMHRSGLVDIQAHSLTHARVACRADIVDFEHPGMPSLLWQRPLTGEESSPAAKPPWGTPWYRATSRCSDTLRFYPHPAVVVACQREVARHGRAFFSRADWRRQLHGVAADAAARHGVGHFESTAQQQAAIRRELIGAREVIEAHLPSARVRHFAFPWSETGQLALDMLPDAGYASASAGLPRGDQRLAVPEGVVLHPRVSGDFIPALPGRGRQMLPRIAWSKLCRRLRASSLTSTSGG